LSDSRRAILKSLIDSTTSQKCSACGHTSKNNRKSQSNFECESCGHSVNAGHNAAKVIAGRGTSYVNQRKAQA